MSRLLYLFTAAITITLVACKPASRYTLHEASEPSTGAKITLRLDSTTGEAQSLASMPTTPGARSLFWSPVLSQDIAIAALNAIQQATNNSRP
jgi:hypothetical protein